MRMENGRWKMDGNAIPSSILQLLSSKLIFAFGVKQPEGAVVVGFRHEDLGGPAQIAVVGQVGIHERLRCRDVVLLQHHDEHFGVDERAGVKKFHGENLATDGHG
jgi:hypothetical protein